MSAQLAAKEARLAKAAELGRGYRGEHRSHR
jgi:hypothetical protein